MILDRRVECDAGPIEVGDVESNGVANAATLARDRGSTSVHLQGWSLWLKR